MDDDKNSEVVEEQVVEEQKPSIAPWRVFFGLGVVGRVTVFAALLAAVAAVTVHNRLAEVLVTEAVSGYVTVAFLLWLAVIDAKSFTLPNKILLIWLTCRAVLIAAGSVIYGTFDILTASFGGAAVVGFFFLITYYLSRRTMGGGDVKLSFVMGLSLTISLVFTAVFFGLVFCAVFAIGGMALKKLGRKDAVPLGPFLFAGTVAAYLLVAIP